MSLPRTPRAQGAHPNQEKDPNMFSGVGTANNACYDCACSRAGEGKPNVYGCECGHMRRPREPVVTRGMLLAQPQREGQRHPVNLMKEASVLPKGVSGSWTTL